MEKIESKPEKKTLTQKISDKITEWKERDGVEIDGGFTVSSATARLLRERPGSEYVGTTFVQLARVVQPGMKDTWVPFKKDQHAHCETKVIVQEFCVVPGGLNNFSEILLSQNGAEPIVIGHKISLDVLRRMSQNSALTEAGQKLLAEQAGEEAMAEASTTK